MADNFQIELDFDESKLLSKLNNLGKQFGKYKIDFKLDFSGADAQGLNRLNTQLQNLSNRAGDLNKINPVLRELKNSLNGLNRLPDFNKLSTSFDTLANNFSKVQNIEEIATQIVGSIGAIATAFNEINIVSANKTGIQGFNEFSKSLDTLFKSFNKTDNIVAQAEKIVEAINKVNQVGGIDVLNKLGPGLTVGKDGTTKTAPIKIDLPTNFADTVRQSLEKQFQQKPAQVKVQPSMDKKDWSQFTNLFISLGFAPFIHQFQQFASSAIRDYTKIQDAQTTFKNVYRDRPEKGVRAFADARQKAIDSPATFDEIMKVSVGAATQRRTLNRLGFKPEDIVNASESLALKNGGDITEAQKALSDVATGNLNGLKILRNQFQVDREKLAQGGYYQPKEGNKLNTDADIKAALNAIFTTIKNDTGGTLVEERRKNLSAQFEALSSSLEEARASAIEPLASDLALVATVTKDLVEGFKTLPEPVRKLAGLFVLAGSAVSSFLQTASQIALTVSAAAQAGLFNRGASAVASVSTTGSVVALSALETEIAAVTTASVALEKAYLDDALALEAEATAAYEAAAGAEAMAASLATLIAANEAVIVAQAEYAAAQELAATRTATASAAAASNPTLAFASGNIASKAAPGFFASVLSGFTGIFTVAGNWIKGIFTTISTAATALAARMGLASATTATSFAGVGTRLGQFGAGLIIAGAAAYVMEQAMESVAEWWDNRQANEQTEEISDKYKNRVNSRTAEQQTAIDDEREKAKTRLSRSAEDMISGGYDINQAQKDQQTIREAAAEARAIKGETSDDFISFSNILKESAGNVKLLGDASKITKQKQESLIKAQEDFRQAQFQAGDLSAQEGAKAAKQVYESRQGEINQAQSALNTFDYNNSHSISNNGVTREKYENDLRDAQQRSYDSLQIYLKWMKSVNEEIVRGIQIADTLKKAQGNFTKLDEINSKSKEIDIMPTRTEEERQAKKQAEANLAVDRYDRSQAIRNARNQNLDNEGHTLASGRDEIAIKARSLRNSIGGADGEIQAKKFQTDALKKLDYDYYQSRLQMATENAAALSKIESQRIENVQNNLKAQQSRLESFLGRTSIDTQAKKDQEVQSLNNRILVEMKRKTNIDLLNEDREYNLKRQALMARINMLEAKSGPQAQEEARSARVGLQRFDASHAETRSGIIQSGRNDVAAFEQAEKFRQRDLAIAKLNSDLEAKITAGMIKRDALEAGLGQKGMSRLAVIQQTQALESQIIKDKLAQALNSDKLTANEIKNLKDRAALEQQILNLKTAQSKLSLANENLGRNKRKVDVVLGADDLNLTPQERLRTMKQGLEIEKAMRENQRKQEVLAAGGENASPDKLAAIQADYQNDIYEIQTKYLKQAKEITGEFEKQNKELLDRYNNEDARSKDAGFSGFSMGEVFGLDELNANLNTDSEYNQLMAGKNLGLSGKNIFSQSSASADQQPYDPNDPFNTDRMQARNYARSAKADVSSFTMNSFNPMVQKDFDKENAGLFATVRVVVDTADGKNLHDEDLRFDSRSLKGKK